MPRTFAQLYNELVGWIPKLDPNHARTLLQRAWDDIRNEWNWSFLQQRGVLFSPALITTGTVSVTQFSASFQMSAAAITALASISNPVITQRQIRIGQRIFTVATYDSGTGAGTFDDIYYDATNATAGYQLYRCYYGPPLDVTGGEVTDFYTYRSIYDPVSNKWLFPLHGQQADLNSRDPNRLAFGNPQSMYAYRTSVVLDPITSAPTYVPLFEMYPHPTAARVYPCVYFRRGGDMVLTEILPQSIPDQLIIERALWYGCKWAAMNQARWPELAGINWRLQSDDHARAYLEILKGSVRIDEELMIESMIPDFHRRPQVIDMAKWPGYSSIPL